MILKDSLIYLIGELVSKSVPFLLLSYLSHKLGADGYGLLSYYQTYLALFVIVIGLSQEGAVARYFYFYGYRSLNMVVNAGYAYSIIIGFIAILICYFLQSTILVCMATLAIFQSFLNVQLVVRQCNKKAVSYVIIQLSLALCLALLSVLILELSESFLVEKYIASLLLSYVVVWFFSYFLYSKTATKKKIHYSYYKRYLFYIIVFGFPLIFHQVSLFLRGQLDRLFIYHQFSETELGIYSIGYQIAFVLSVTIQAINKAIIPYFYDGLKKGRIRARDIKKISMMSLFLTPIPSICVYLVPNEFFLWLLGHEFIEVKYFILIFLVANVLSIPYLILVNYLFFYGKNKLISISSLISTLIYILLLLVILTFNNIKYVPYASVFGAIMIIPFLYFMVVRVSKET